MWVHLERHGIDPLVQRLKNGSSAQYISISHTPAIQEHSTDQPTHNQQIRTELQKQLTVPDTLPNGALTRENVELNRNSRRKLYIKEG